MGIGGAKKNNRARGPPTNHKTPKRSENDEDYVPYREGYGYFFHIYEPMKYYHQTFTYTEELPEISCAILVDHNFHRRDALKRKLG